MDLLRLAPDLVSVRSISMPLLIKGGGVLHSKLLVADRRHFYLGSANLSDRGLTKTKGKVYFLKNNLETSSNYRVRQQYWHP